MISNNDKTAGRITHLLFLVFMAGMVFSWRAVCSISISAVFVWGIFLNRGSLRNAAPVQKTIWLLLACCLYFVLQGLAVFYSQDRSNAWSNMQLKTGMLITPVAVILCSTQLKKTFLLLLWQYCWLLSIAAAFCLVKAWELYRATGNESVFFYHELAHPLSGHAIYLSLLVTVAILFLTETLFKQITPLRRRIAFGLLIFLLTFIVLLSSRLVLIFLAGYFLYTVTRLLHFNGFRRVTIAGSFGIFALLVVSMFGTRNPVSRRFYDIIDGRLSMVWQKNFTPGDYFNGLQFRLLQWKLVPGILTEKKRWLLGVSTGDAQAALDDKYLSLHMYAGDPDRGKKGYLAYNTHNQFLQSLLQTGLAGLAALILLTSLLLFNVWRSPGKLAKVFTVLLLLWLFTEAPLETQYGIILFFFFPLLLSLEPANIGSKANLLSLTSD